jgi:Fic family protein
MAPLNEESLAAHESIVKQKTKLHRDILEIVDRVGYGLTCDEVENLLGLSHQTASARISELKAMGELVKRGVRPTRSGRNAAVLVHVVAK